MNILLQQKFVRRVLRRMMGALTHVKTDAAVVALTFDDGPHPEFTPRLLDILDHYQAKATFFVLGEHARQQPAIIERMAHTGHAIGNHTWDHPSLPMLTRTARRAQLRASAKAVSPHGKKLFRPPYGNLTFASNLDVWLLGYQTVTWNIVGQDWLRDGVENLTERITSRLTPGSIVLLHDALYDSTSNDAFNREDTLHAVEKVLQQFHDHFQFVTVPDLIRCGRPQYQYWERPPNISWLSALHQQ